VAVLALAMYALADVSCDQFRLGRRLYALGNNGDRRDRERRQRSELQRRERDLSAGVIGVILLATILAENPVASASAPPVQATSSHTQ
jgi:hypothetical protein